MKKKQLLTAGLILCLALFSACGISKPADTAPEVKSETATGIIHLSNQGTTSDCAGVEIAGSRVTITEAGKYELSGTLDAGQLIVDCSGKVTLTLCGTSITNPENAAIDVLNAKKVTLQLAEGSENVLVSGVSVPTVSTEETTGAVIHSKKDLVISGNGSLTVTGYLNNGISSSDELTIKGGSIFVTAANHGLKGKDGVNISGGSIDIRASADGIHSDSQVSVSDGSISISVQDDGIHADDSLNITGGNTVISDSYEGLEANQITISGGNISVAATDDGLNACGGASSFGKEASG